MELHLKDCIVLSQMSILGVCIHSDELIEAAVTTQGYYLDSCWEESANGQLKKVDIWWSSKKLKNQCCENT